MPSTVPSPRRLVTGLVLVAGLGAGAGCEIAPPELPRFTSTITVPLGRQRVTAAEIAADESFLAVGADSLLSLTISGGSDTLSVAAELAADLPATTVAATLGDFAPIGGAPVGFDFALRAIYPAAVSLDGATVTVPPFSFDLDGAPADLPNLIAARVASGRLEVTVVNGLPVTVSGAVPPARVAVALIDPGTGATLATVLFPAPIAAGATVTASADLAGIALPDSIGVRLTGGSPGAATPVTIDADARLRLSASLRDLRVVEATALVGAQAFTAVATVALPDSVRVVTAEITEGTLNLTVDNDLAIPCVASLTFPEIAGPDGQPLTTSLTLPARSGGTRALALAGSRLVAPGAVPLAALRLEAAVTSPGGGSLPVTLAADDALRATVAPTRLRFGAVTGVIPARQFAIAPITAHLDLPDELSGVSLTSAALTLVVDSAIDLPARLAATLTGRSSAGAVATVEVLRDLPPSSQPDPEGGEIVLDEGNSAIVDFLNNLPTEITLTGVVTVGGDGVIGTVRPGDRAVIGWRLDAPLRVIVLGSVVRGDPQPLELDAEARERLAGHLGAVRIVTDIVNHLPLGVEIRILVGEDPATLADAPQLVVGPLTASAGQLDPDLLTVRDATLTRGETALTAAQAELLTRAGLQIVVEVTLPGSNGQTVSLRASDWLTVTGCVQIELEVSDDE
jgi:hypothetical protein